MKKLALILGLCVVAAPSSAAPAFHDFSVADVYKGRTVYPQFAGRDRASRGSRTTIRRGLKDGPNFAGEWSVIEMGCGTGCRIYFVVSNRTGEVFGFPGGGEENPYLDLAYQLSSRLLVARWQIGPDPWGLYINKDPRCVLKYYEWNSDEKKLTLLKSRKERRRACEVDLGTLVPN